VVKWISLYTHQAGESVATTSVSIFRSPTVARFESNAGASFDAQLVDLEAETATYLFVEKKIAVVTALAPPADYLLDQMTGKSLSVELRPTQRTKSFGTRTCREHSARVAISLDKKVTIVTTAPGIANQWTSRLKPQWQWILEGRVWLGAPPENVRDDVKFRNELESRHLSLWVPRPEPPDEWLRSRALNRLRAAALRRGDFCAEALTYSPPPEWIRTFMGLRRGRPEDWLPTSWTAEIVSIEESEIGDDQFVVPPGYKVGQGTYTFR